MEVPDYEDQSQTAEEHYTSLILKDVEDMLDDSKRTGLSKEAAYWCGVGQVRAMLKTGTFNQSTAARVKGRIINLCYGLSDPTRKDDGRLTQYSCIRYDPEQHQPLDKWCKGKPDPSQPGYYTILMLIYGHLYISYRCKWNGERLIRANGSNEIKSAAYYLPASYEPHIFRIKERRR